jgi:mannose-1-phosphate guanylyltransferase
MDIPSISIDYAVMERNKKIKVVFYNLTGLIWGSLNRCTTMVSIGHKVDENGNMVIGTNNYTAL